jgi:3-phenylpropionate/cinnamic acid dioxygenase small subunit
VGLFPAGRIEIHEEVSLTQQEISDHIEITQLIYRYAKAIDTRDFELLSSVFTPDASIHYEVERGTKLPFREMVGWLREVLQIFRVTQHLMTNPSIELHGDTASSQTYLTASHVQRKLDGEDVMTVQGGVYSDLHVRTELGWRIKQRTLKDVYVQGEFLGPDQVQKFAQPGPR